LRSACAFSDKMMSYFLFIAVAQGCNFSCIDLLKDARSLNYSGLTTGTLPPICVPGSASSALQLGAFNEQTAIAAALSNGNVNVNAMYTSNCVTSNLVSRCGFFLCVSSSERSLRALDLCNTCGHETNISSRCAVKL
jgi:hypothetical protein